MLQTLHIALEISPAQNVQAFPAEVDIIAVPVFLVIGEQIAGIHIFTLYILRYLL